MKNIFIYPKNQKGSSIIETLIALGFISVVSSAFINLSIVSRRLSYQHQVQSNLGRYAGIIAEEIVKDYTLNNSVSIGENSACNYCEDSEGVGLLIDKFLSDYDGNQCSVISSGDGNYVVNLSVEVFEKVIATERQVILK